MKENKSVVVKTKDSIVFQLSALNLMMLVAFILVMVMIIMSMNKSTSSSITMFGNMMNLTTHEASLKNDIMNLYDQTTGYIAAEADETKVALLPQINVAKETRHQPTQSSLIKPRFRRLPSSTPPRFWIRPSAIQQLKPPQ